MERARDEIVAAALERLDTVDRVGPRLAEHDHRHIAVPRASGSALPQPPADLQACRVLERADQHEVGPRPLDELQRLPLGVRAEHLEPLAGQVPLQEGPRPGLGLG